MTRTHCEISMSLDGFITGPNEGVGNPLGDDDGRLHDWMFGKATDADASVLGEAYARTGAIVMGKRMFDVGVEPWGALLRCGSAKMPASPAPADALQSQG
jgi:hypothetical protein